MVIEAQCPAGGGRALARVREVLEIVLERSQGEWPPLEEWKRVLPGWFVAACVDDAEVRDCVIDRWSLRAWIYWFQPGLRKGDGGRASPQRRRCASRSWSSSGRICVGLWTG